MPPEKTGEEQAERDPVGRWTRGVSGNPGGRPKGSRNKTTRICEDLLSGEAEGLVRQCIKLAKDGDGVALKLCIERLVPVRAARDRAVDVAVPDVARAQDIAEAAAAVIAHAAVGEISLSEAKEFMHLLESQRKMIETLDLAVRVEALEGGGDRRGVGVGGGPVDAEVAVRVRRIVREGGERR